MARRAEKMFALKRGLTIALVPRDILP